MIEVKINITPFGVRQATREIAYIKIANVGGDNDIANYISKVVLDGEEKEIEIKNFKRNRRVFALLYEVLKQYLK